MANAILLWIDRGSVANLATMTLAGDLAKVSSLNLASVTPAAQKRLRFTAATAICKTEMQNAGPQTGIIRFFLRPFRRPSTYAPIGAPLPPSFESPSDVQSIPSTSKANRPLWNEPLEPLSFSDTVPVCEK